MTDYYPPQPSPGSYPRPAPQKNGTPVGIGVAVVALILFGLTGCSMASTAPSPHERAYLAHVKDPSAYPLYSHCNCSDSWGPWPDDQTLVAQGHQICTDIRKYERNGSAAMDVEILMNPFHYPDEQARHQVVVAGEDLC